MDLDPAVLYRPSDALAGLLRVANPLKGEMGHGQNKIIRPTGVAMLYRRHGKET
jgi:hypothetical protein